MIRPPGNFSPGKGEFFGICDAIYPDCASAQHFSYHQCGKARRRACRDDNLRALTQQHAKYLQRHKAQPYLAIEIGINDDVATVIANSLWCWLLGGYVNQLCAVKSGFEAEQLYPVSACRGDCQYLHDGLKVFMVVSSAQRFPARTLADQSDEQPAQCRSGCRRFDGQPDRYGLGYPFFLQSPISISPRIRHLAVV